MKPLLLDLYCGQGGAGAGYVASGFDVVGVDLIDQPRYPFDFIRAGAIEVMIELLDGKTVGPSRQGRYCRLEDFVAIHASPPCQAYSVTQRIQDRIHTYLIGVTRECLVGSGLPYVIENVPDALRYLVDPIMICVPAVGVEMYRHRYFECHGFECVEPDHPPHVARQVKMGRPAAPGEFIQAVGNFSGVERARQVMGMPWANRDGLREAIPPAYSKYVGDQIMREVA